MSRRSRKAAKIWNKIAVPLIEWTGYTIVVIAAIGCLIGSGWLVETLLQ